MRGSSSPTNLGAEIGVPGVAVGGDDHVVRIGVLPRQIVLGDDYASGAALGARVGLELVFLGFRVGEAHVDHELRRGLGDRGIDARALAARATGRQQLRLRRRRAGIVAAHAVEHLDPFVHGVLCGEHPLQRVAAGAAGEELLVAIGAGQARHPFGVGELKLDITGAVEREIGLGVAAAGNLDRLRPAEDVADGADGDGVVAGLEPVGGEAVLALVVGHHRGGDGRAFPFHVDENAFHRPFLGRRHLAAERDLRLRGRRRRAGEDDCGHEQEAEMRRSHGRLPRRSGGGLTLRLFLDLRLQPVLAPRPRVARGFRRGARFSRRQPRGTPARRAPRVAGMSSSRAGLAGDGVGDGVHHRRDRAGGAGFADALDAERIGRRRHRMHGVAHRRHVVGARHGVVHERAGDELAAVGS